MCFERPIVSYDFSVKRCETLIDTKRIKAGFMGEGGFLKNLFIYFCLFFPRRWKT